MSALQLKAVLSDAGVSIAEFARETEMPRSVMSSLCNYGLWPKKNPGELRARIKTFLKERALPTEGVFSKKKAPKRANASRPVVPPTREDEETLDMVTHKPELTLAARKHFNLGADPFAEPEHIDDVYLSRDMRIVLETMRQKAIRPGGFLAVVGESGSGKSTLSDTLQDKLARADGSVIVIKPSVRTSVDRDTRGKPITSAYVAEFIMAALAPAVSLRSSTAARQMQLERTLIDSFRAGNRHLLLIEEAHDLTRTMLKHLKRLLETKDGLARTLSIVLIAQPELLHKLNPNDPSMREVVQRCEVVTLPPLDNDLHAYLKHRFARIGVELSNVVDESGIDALRARLTPAKSRAHGSLLYPLAVHNCLAAAMNECASLGAPKVTRDIVAGGVS